MQYEEIIDLLIEQSDPEAAAGKARFGVKGANVLGISVPALRVLGKQIGKDQSLAEQLWGSGLHEARILATLVAEPLAFSETLMDQWAGDFDSWDLCDACCANLFFRTPYAYSKAMAWSERDEEYVRRAGFTMMAVLAIHDKKAQDESFEAFFPAIMQEAGDERNFVRKAVNWALRQIGKRSQRLNKLAVELAEEIKMQDTRTARWIAADALKELTSDKIQKRLELKESG